MLPVAALFIVAPQMIATTAYEILVIMIAKIVPLGMALFGSLESINQLLIIHISKYAISIYFEISRNVGSCQDPDSGRKINGENGKEILHLAICDCVTGAPIFSD